MLAALALAVVSLGDHAPRLDRIPPHAEIDALIARLPQVGSERVLDEKGASTGLLPDVERMRALVVVHALDDAQWRRALIDTGVVRWRERWPRDVPFTICLRRAEWMGRILMVLDAHRAGWTPAMVQSYSGSCTSSEEPFYMYQRLGPLESRDTEVVLDVRVERQANGRDAEYYLRGAIGADEASQGKDGELLWSGTLTLPVSVVASIDDALPPVRSTELDRAVERAFGIGFEYERKSWSDVSFWLCDAPPELLGIAFCLEVDVLRDGVVVDSVLLGATARDRSRESDEAEQRWGQTSGWARLEHVPSTLEAVRATHSVWSFRLHGGTKGAPLYWNATRRWAGDLVLSLDDVIAANEARRAARPR